MDEDDYENWDLKTASESPKELRFVTEPPVELICPLCLHVLRDPFQTQCCGQYCCQSCLQTLFSKRKPCTLCQSQVRAFRNFNVARRVNALAVKCSNETYGCTWTGELGELGHHLLLCEKKHVRCDMCEDTVLNNHLDAHMSTECMKRMFRCPHCNQYESTYETVRDDHWPTCSLYPIPCPNECSKGSIPRNKVFYHLKRRCSIKRKVKEMAEMTRQMQEQLKERDLRIEQLENEIRPRRKGTGRHESHVLCSISYMEEPQPALKKMKSDNERLVEKVTAVQKERAELEHENKCLAKEIETHDLRIQELEIQNKIFRENLDQMSDKLASQLKVMNDTLRDENGSLETKLSGIEQTLCDSCT